MPGANYMGGKRPVKRRQQCSTKTTDIFGNRNAMKARSKDTVGRQQKGFFGRQRLDMLSKGLCTSNATETTTFLLSKGLENIDLAHARQKIPLDDRILRSYIPSPVRVSPSTPRSHKRTRKELHTSSSDTRHSKAVEALDTLEPLSLRRNLDRILAMPNLACLSNSNVVNQTASSQQRNRVSNSDSEDPNPRSKILLKESPLLKKYSRIKGVPCTPQKSRLSRHDYASKQALNPSSETSASPFLESSDGFSYGADGGSVRDSGFWELQSVEAEKTCYSSPWTKQQRQSSSPCSGYDERVGQADWESLMDADSSKGRRFAPSNSSSPAATPQNLFNGANLPSYIRLGPEKAASVRYASTDEDKKHTVYGSLFEQRDPWSTVGFILGLPASENKSGSSPSPPEINCQVKNGDLDSTTMAKRTEMNDLWDGDVDYDEDFNSLFDGTWMSSSPALRPIAMDVTEISTIPRISPGGLTSPVSPSRSFVKTPPQKFVENYTNLLGRRDVPKNFDAHSGDGRDELEDHGIPNLPEKSLYIYGSSPGRGECEDISFAGSGDNDNCSDTFGSPTMKRDSEDNYERPSAGLPEDLGQEYVDQNVNTPENQQDHEVIGLEDEPENETRGMDCDVLVIPNLREVNGRFVGPTLFDDFDHESDEE